MSASVSLTLSRCEIQSSTLPADLADRRRSGRLLRTTRRAVYAMVERAQLPGVTRIGRRVLVRSADLLDWLDQKSALSLKE